MVRRGREVGLLHEGSLEQTLHHWEEASALGDVVHRSALQQAVWQTVGKQNESPEVAASLFRFALCLSARCRNFRRGASCGVVLLALPSLTLTLTLT